MKNLQTLFYGYISNLNVRALHRSPGDPMRCFFLPVFAA